MSAPRPSPRRRWLDRLCWLAVVLSPLVAAAVAGHLLLLRYALARQSPAGYSAASVPSVALAARRAELEKVRVESLQLSRGVQSVRQALGLLIAADNPEAFFAANSYLGDADIDPSEQRLAVDVLLSERVALSSIGLKVLEKYGRPEDAPLLAKKTPPAQHIGDWLDLLAKWNAAPEPEIVTYLLKDDSRAWPCALALAARGMAQHPAAFETLLSSNMPSAARNEILKGFTPQDRRAVQILAMLAVVEPLPASIAAQLKADPPNDDLVRKIREAIKTAPNSSPNGPWDYLARTVPALFVLDDPELWTWLEQQMKVAPGQAPHPDAQRVTAALVWQFEKTPSSGAARVLAATVPSAAAVPWSVADLLRRRPDLRTSLGIPEPQIAAAATNPDAAAPGAEAISPEQIDAALADLKTDDSARVAAACRTLAETVVDEARRSEVIAALERPGNGLASASTQSRIAYCRWAAPASHAYVAHLAVSDGDTEVRCAALRALIAAKSPHLPEVARRHISESGWTTTLVDAWNQSGPAGEAALCQAMARFGVRGINLQAVKSLSRCGGEPALRLLEVLREQLEVASQSGRGDMESQKQAIEAAAEQLRHRVSQANSTTAPPAPPTADATEKGPGESP